MFESFVVMLREGVESALVPGILVTLLRRSGRRELMRPVWTGAVLAAVASVGAAWLLKRELMPFPEQVYEGTLYWGSAALVVTMMLWINRKARLLKFQIQAKVEQALGAGAGIRQRLAIGLAAFVMIFREGAETVLFLSAIKLTTGTLASAAGTLLGLAGAVAFYVLFVNGSLRVGLGRFFKVTQWMLTIFVAQLVLDGYQEFVELGALPASAGVKSVLGPLVENNALFILALVAMPLFIWLTRDCRAVRAGASPEEQAAAAAALRRDTLFRWGAVAGSLMVMAALAAGYARQALCRPAAPEPARTADQD